MTQLADKGDHATPANGPQQLRVPVAAALLIAAVLLALSFYHPYFFGDEIAAFNAAPGNGLVDTFVAMNAYKPRLLLNLTWATIVAYQLPRWVPMLVFAMALGAAAVLFYRIARDAFAAQHRTALLAAGLLLVSRFDAMLYYDYILGTIEALSLMLFLAGLRLLSGPVLLGDDRHLRTPSVVAGCALWLLVIVVHERYIAAFAAIAAMLVVRALVTRGLPGMLRMLPLAAAIAMLPVALYVGLVVGLSDTSVTTGTSNQEVTFGLNTLRIAATYASNVLLGSNYGPSWLNGHLNHLHPWHPVVFAISGIAALAAYAWPWIHRRARHLGTPTQLWSAALLLLAAAAMMVVASLPGYERQEARWMLPVLTLVMLALLAIYRGVAARVVLGVLLASQLFYGAWGGLQTIAAIHSSRTAQALATSLNAIDPPGEAGAMLQSAEPDTSWILGNDGEAFCRVNLGGTNCLMPKKAASRAEPGRIGFGVSSSAVNALDAPKFRLVGNELAEMVLHPQQSGGGVALGEANHWSCWALGPTAQVTAQGLRVAGMGDNFCRMGVAELRDALLVYRASSPSGHPVSFRLQVNWHDPTDRFIAAQIEVVEALAAPGNFATLLVPPPGAGVGYVYATLHDGAKEPVVLHSVRIVAP